MGVLLQLDNAYQKNASGLAETWREVLWCSGVKYFNPLQSACQVV
jgi:hypothetical protein